LPACFAQVNSKQGYAKLQISASGGINRFVPHATENKSRANRDTALFMHYIEISSLFSNKYYFLFFAEPKIKSCRAKNIIDYTLYLSFNIDLFFYCQTKILSKSQAAISTSN